MNFLLETDVVIERGSVSYRFPLSRIHEHFAGLEELSVSESFEYIKKVESKNANFRKISSLISILSTENHNTETFKRSYVTIF